MKINVGKVFSDTKAGLLLCVFLLAAGFFVGRATITYRTEIKYVKGDIIRDTIFNPVPVLEIVHDTIFLIERDTVKTLIDWNTERIYAGRVFDNKAGTLDYSATIQYNRLQSISFESVPLYKEITRYKIKVWQPYVGTSVNTFGQASFSAGTFYKKTGVELQYLYDFERGKKGYGIGVKYQF